MLKKQNIFNLLSICAVLTTTSVSAQPIVTEIEPIRPIQEFTTTPLSTSVSTPTSIPIYVPLPEKSQSTGYCSTVLAPKIENVIRRYGGGWGILVQKLDDGQTIYHYNAD